MTDPHIQTHFESVKKEWYNHFFHKKDFTTLRTSKANHSIDTQSIFNLDPLCDCVTSTITQQLNDKNRVYLCRRMYQAYGTIKIPHLKPDEKIERATLVQPCGYPSHPELCKLWLKEAAKQAHEGEFYYRGNGVIADHQVVGYYGLIARERVIAHGVIGDHENERVIADHERVIHEWQFSSGQIAPERVIADHERVIHDWQFSPGQVANYHLNVATIEDFPQWNTFDFVDEKHPISVSFPMEPAYIQFEFNKPRSTPRNVEIKTYRLRR